jgi:hypothetical protein
MVDVLGLRRTRNYIPLKGINNVPSDAKHSVNIQLCSRYNKFQAEVMCFILPKITEAATSCLRVEENSLHAQLQRFWAVEFHTLPKLQRNWNLEIISKQPLHEMTLEDL